MVFELVKNSLRAVQERFMNSDKDVPPVRIIVADGIEDVTIKVRAFDFLPYFNIVPWCDASQLWQIVNKLIAQVFFLSVEKSS